MKQILRYSFVMLLSFICGGMNAGTIDFSTLGLENSVQYTTPFDGGDFTVTFAGGANDGKYYTTGTAIRVYGGGTMTIAAKSGNLTKLVITFDGSNKPADGTVVDGGTYDAESGTWTGSASSVVFTRPSGSGHWRVQKVEATIGEPSGKKTTTIEFSEGYETRATCGKDESVNLPTATVKSEGAAVAGAAVTWESNKTDIATIDGNKVKIANGTQGEVTIKASYAGDATYESSTKTYKLTVYKGTGLLKELVKEVTNGNEKWDNGGEFQSYWFVDLDNGMTSVPNIVTFASGQYIYLTDGENNLLFYGTNSKNLKKGDKVSGDLGGGNLGAIWGKLYRYNKLPEFSFTDLEVKVESEGNAVEPKTITVDKLADNINAYLKIVDAEFVSAGSGKNLNFKVGDIDLLVYNQFNVDASTLEAGSKYTLEGMGAKYNDNIQLYPISFTKQGGGSGAIYSWESPEGTAAETGGKATYENGETDESKYRVNYKNGDYYTICINGKKANMDDAPGTANGGYILVTLDNELKTDDAIELTGYLNKNAAGKEASIYFLFEKGDGVDDEYTYGDADNIDPTVGGKISTHTFKVPAASNGSKSFKMSRSKADTNIFLTKLVITSGGSTGISTVKTVRVDDGAIYNLAGQKVDNSYKGVVIKNGKKVINK